MTVTKDQWMDWKNSPVTRQFLSDVMNNRMELLEGIADGIAGPQERDILIGRTQGIKDTVLYATTGFNYHEEVTDGN